MDPIVRVPIVSQVEVRIRAMIENKIYRPGMKLPTEYEFCEMLQVGRGTVREALRTLQAKGLVEIKPGRGAFVAESEPVDANPIVWLVQNKKELRDSIEVRNALEPLAARKMAENGSEEAMHALQRIHEDFLEAIEKGESDRIAELDESFHSLIVRESGNQLLSEINLHLCQGMHTFRSKTFTVLQNVRNAVIPHTRIMDAILRRDGASAEKEMRQHLKMVEEDLDSNTQIRTDI